MSSGELQRKIRLVNERKKAAQLPEKLTGIQVVGYESEIPAWVADAQKACLSITSIPDVRISDGVNDSEVEAWYVELLHSGGIGQRFYCSTGMENFPWVDCLIIGEGWLSSVRAALGDDICFVSHSKTSLVVVFSEEYEYIGFRCTEVSKKGEGKSSNGGEEG
ncbi:hypothetical protein [Streptomyces sp. NPDC046261]|uniref:hypothetical protein n=1 Tax=Streptomyces sp. NPDC046261 TaxID=3157200 RepID=UPI0033F1564B